MQLGFFKYNDLFGGTFVHIWVFVKKPCPYAKLESRVFFLNIFWSIHPMVNQ